jgi:hypothetical protein
MGRQFRRDDLASSKTHSSFNSESSKRSMSPWVKLDGPVND